ncbi:MAG: ubiquinone biosynthesis protein UbiB [bacterium]|nr:ubiquinone biosynthesis protein UbiB [bacterium]
MGSLLIEFLSSARDLSRAREIGTVLAKHGMGDLARRVGLSRVLRGAGRALHVDRARDIVDRPPEERLRLALEELGPTFVKVGQLLASRTDLLPRSWTTELARLREQVSPEPAEEIRAQLTEDLGAPPEEVFASFEEEPLAAGSIAQVHGAVLHSGERVVLKVRRPDIARLADRDLALMDRLARKLEESVPELRRFRPERILHQLARAFRDEMDLRLEARNMARMRRSLSHEKRVVVPRVHDEWTSERLCVMERLDGPSVGEWMRGAEPSPASRAVAEIGADMVLHMIFVDGFFHADPHAGNVLVLGDGRIGLLDFGMVGRLGEMRRLELLELVSAILERRIDDVVDVLRAWSPEGDPNEHDLIADCTSFVDRYADLSLAQLDIGALLVDLAALLRANDLYLPEDIALLIKVFLTLEGTGRELDPDFVVSERVEPFARRSLEDLASPRAALRRGMKEMREFVATLPADLRSVVRAAGRGRVRFEVEHKNVDRLARQMDSVATRVTIGLVTSALIIGTAIALNVSSGPRPLGVSMFGVLGFTSSLAAGVWLLWTLRRIDTR